MREREREQVDLEILKKDKAKVLSAPLSLVSPLYKMLMQLRAGRAPGPGAPARARAPGARRTAHDRERELGVELGPSGVGTGAAAGRG